MVQISEKVFEAQISNDEYFGIDRSSTMFPDVQKGDIVVSMVDTREFEDEPIVIRYDFSRKPIRIRVNVHDFVLPFRLPFFQYVFPDETRMTAWQLVYLVTDVVVPFLTAPDRDCIEQDYTLTVESLPVPSEPTWLQSFRFNLMNSGISKLPISSKKPFVDSKKRLQAGSQSMILFQDQEYFKNFESSLEYLPTWKKNNPLLAKLMKASGKLEIPNVDFVSTIVMDPSSYLSSNLVDVVNTCDNSVVQIVLVRNRVKNRFSDEDIASFSLGDNTKLYTFLFVDPKTSSVQPCRACINKRSRRVFTKDEANAIINTNLRNYVFTNPKVTGLGTTSCDYYNVDTAADSSEDDFSTFLSTATSQSVYRTPAELQKLFEQLQRERYQSSADE